MDPEDGPLARLCVDVDLPSRPGDDPVDGREAETGSIALVLRGEEGLERPRGDLRLHPLAVVRDRQPDVPAGCDAGVLVQEVTVELHLAGLDLEAPTIRHGVAGVHR